MRVSARENFVCYAHYTSMLAIIIIAAPTPFYVVHTINRRSAYRESLENHRYYLCHVSLQQLKLCYGLQKISQQECLCKFVGSTIVDSLVPRLCSIIISIMDANTCLQNYVQGIQYLTDMDRLISVIIQSIRCQSVTLEAKQKACIKFVYNFLPATVNICATRCYHSLLVTSLTGKIVLCSLCLLCSQLQPI